MSSRLLSFVTLAALFPLATSCVKAQAAGQRAAVTPVSRVDTSLRGSEKYVLRVDDKPFFMTNIQIRLDKLRYAWGFDAKAREALVAQAAKDGFNTVSIPIHWYEVEPHKDNFDWGVLDEYLSIVQQNGLKIEMLWFGQNSGGHVQSLGLGDRSVHLRTPDYVLQSPSPDSNETKSDYAIRKDMTPYSRSRRRGPAQTRDVRARPRDAAHS